MHNMDNNHIHVYIHFVGNREDEILEKKISHLNIKLGETIMTAIQDFYAKQSEFNTKMETALSGLQGDIQALNDLIVKLQNTPGNITPEDQALLDQLEAKSSELADKFTALDEMTPPVIPPEGVAK